MGHGNSLSPRRVELYLALLYPLTYRYFATGRAGEPMDVGTASRILLAILRTIQLRKTMAAIVDLEDGRKVRIREEIPPYDIYTVELQISKDQAAAYHKVYHQADKNLGSGVDDETQTGRIRMSQYRRLCHVVANPILETLVSKSSVKDVNSWYNDNYDHGATKLFKKTNPLA